jgi:hypothetical protein
MLATRPHRGGVMMLDAADRACPSCGGELFEVKGVTSALGEQNLLRLPRDCRDHFGHGLGDTLPR